jgi:hypothetical protein
MSTINQINNLSNAATTHIGGNGAGESTQDADWFSNTSTYTAQAITATPYFESSSTIDQISLSILSCIGATSTL